MAALAGNAAAGGLMLALAANQVWCRAGAVLNPHYRLMGLHGSEYWTYTLPRRVGTAEAARLTQACLPVTPASALRTGLVNEVIAADPAGYRAQVAALAGQLAASPDHAARLAAKARRLAADGRQRPLAAYRGAELAIMSRNFAGPASRTPGCAGPSCTRTSPRTRHPTSPATAPIPGPPTPCGPGHGRQPRSWPGSRTVVLLSAARVKSCHEHFHPRGLIGDPSQHAVKFGRRRLPLLPVVLREPADDADRPQQLQGRRTQVLRHLICRPARRGLSRAARSSLLRYSRERHAERPVAALCTHGRGLSGAFRQLGRLAERPQGGLCQGERRACQQREHGARRGPRSPPQSGRYRQGRP